MERANGFRPEYVEAAIAGEVARVALAAPSSRNDTLNRAAFNLASLGLAGSDIIGALRPAAEQAGLRRSEIYSTINSGMKAGRQQPRPAPTSCGRYAGPVRVTPRPVPMAPAISVEGAESTPAAPLPRCDAPNKFADGDDGPPARHGELRRHVYRRGGVPVRVKIKTQRDDGASYQNWYAVAKSNGVIGWQAQKPAGYVAVPYVGAGLNPFDPELSRDTLLWPEGEKDCDMLARQGVPAFTFGGTGDGLPNEAASYLAGRHIAILADNDAGGEAHADKKAALAHDAGAASVRVIRFPELPPKGDVTDFLGASGRIEEMHARIDAAPMWSPPDEDCAGGERSSGVAVGLVARCAADIAPKKIDWAWRLRIAIGKHTMIGGEGGCTKSQFLGYLAAQFSTGGDWPAGEGRAPLGNVIMFSAEDDAEDTIVPRLMAAGADLSRIRIVQAAKDADGERLFNLQRDLAALEREITNFGNVKLITFDPISSYLGPKVDGNGNNDVRRVVEPLSRIAAKHRAAIVSLTHSPKGSGTKALNQFIGSVAFVNVVRAAFLFMRDPDDADRILFLTAKANLGKSPPGLAYRLGLEFIGEEKDIEAPRILWESEPVAITANEVLAAANAAGQDRNTKDEAVEFLKELLAKGPVAQKEIEKEADAAGFSWATIKRAKKAAGVMAERRGVEGQRGAGRWYWSIPGQAPNGRDGADQSIKGLRGSGFPLEPLNPLMGSGEPLNRGEGGDA
jgi:putative DNA primase/helicase